MKTRRTNLSGLISKFLRRKTSLLLTAFMLGMSNAILEEDRSINDTRKKIELPDQQDDEKP